MERSMRIPPDLKQAMMGLGSISLFALALFIGKPIVFYAVIGVFFAFTFGYTIFRTSKMIPLMKENAREAAQIRKQTRDKVVFRQTAKDTQPFFLDYEQERLQMSKKMMIMMIIPIVVLFVIYIGFPFVYKLITGFTFTKIQHIELYVGSALASLGASLVVRRRLGLNAAAMASGAQLVHAPKSYIVTPKGVVFEAAQKMADVEYSVLKFPATIKRTIKERSLIELETLDPKAPQQLKIIRLYTKDIDKLTNIISSISDGKNTQQLVKTGSKSV
ncbi:MAG: DUF2208 family protein [Thermoprotei archaeon]